MSAELPKSLVSKRNLEKYYKNLFVNSHYLLLSVESCSSLGLAQQQPIFQDLFWFNNNNKKKL